MRPESGAAGRGVEVAEGGRGSAIGVGDAAVAGSSSSISASRGVETKLALLSTQDR